MSEFADLRLFDGRLLKRTLRLLQPGPETSVLEMKRLDLAQGELIQLFTGTGERTLRYLAIIEFRPDQPRGNHYHLRKEEWVYVILGHVDLVARDRSSNSTTQLRLNAGDVAFIGPGVEHVLKPGAAGYGIEFSTTPFDPQDTYRAAL